MRIVAGHRAGVCAPGNAARRQRKRCAPRHAVGTCRGRCRQRGDGKPASATSMPQIAAMAQARRIGTRRSLVWPGVTLVVGADGDAGSWWCRRPGSGCCRRRTDGGVARGMWRGAREPIAGCSLRRWALQSRWIFSISRECWEKAGSLSCSQVAQLSRGTSPPGSQPPLRDARFAERANLRCQLSPRHWPARAWSTPHGPAGATS